MPPYAEEETAGAVDAAIIDPGITQGQLVLYGRRFAAESAVRGRSEGL